MTKTVLSQQISIKMKSLRKQRLLTQEELAKDICQRSTISRYESGKIKLPSAIILKELVERFGLTLDDFFTSFFDASCRITSQNKRMITNLFVEKDFHKVQDICETMLEHVISLTDRQFLLLMIGYCYSQMGMYARARHHFHQALILTMPNTAADYETSAELLIAYATLCNDAKDDYIQRDDIVTSLNKIERCLAKHPSEDRYDYSTIFGGMGRLYCELDIQEKAINCLNQATEIVEHSSKLWDYGKTLLNYAMYYNETANEEKVIEYLNRSHSFYYALNRHDMFEVLQQKVEQYSERFPALKEKVKFYEK